MTEELQKLSEKITEIAVDNAQIIEIGFVGLMAMAYDKGMAAETRAELRNVFFAGAQHLFKSILCFLDDGEEPTETDLKRISLIQLELDKFIKEFELRLTKPKGNA